MRIAGLMLLIAFCVMGTESCSSANLKHEEKIPLFWKWFQANQSALLASDNPGDKVHVELGEKLKRIESDLTYEIGKSVNGKRELDISADGIPELFAMVEKVVCAAPKMQNWKIVAFRQRVSPVVLNDLAIRGGPIGGGESVDMAVKDMRASIALAGAKANLTMYLKNYSGQEGQQNMALIILQQAVGEHDLVTKVGDIRFASSTEASPKNSFPFVRLGAELDKLLPPGSP